MFISYNHINMQILITNNKIFQIIAINDELFFNFVTNEINNYNLSISTRLINHL